MVEVAVPIKPIPKAENAPVVTASKEPAHPLEVQRAKEAIQGWVDCVWKSDRPLVEPGYATEKQIIADIIAEKGPTHTPTPEEISAIHKTREDEQKAALTKDVEFTDTEIARVAEDLVISDPNWQGKDPLSQEVKVAALQKAQTTRRESLKHSFSILYGIGDAQAAFETALKQTLERNKTAALGKKRDEILRHVNDLRGSENQLTELPIEDANKLALSRDELATLQESAIDEVSSTYMDDQGRLYRVDQYGQPNQQESLDEKEVYEPIYQELQRESKLKDSEDKPTAEAVEAKKLLESINYDPEAKVFRVLSVTEKEHNLQDEIISDSLDFGVKAFLAIATDPEIRKILEKGVPRIKESLSEKLPFKGDSEKKKRLGEIDWDSPDLQEILKRDPHSAAGRIGIILTDLHRLDSEKPDSTDSNLVQELQTAKMLHTAAMHEELSTIKLESLDKDGSLAKEFSELSTKAQLLQTPLSIFSGKEGYTEQIKGIMRKGIGKSIGRELKPDEFEIENKDVFPLLITASRFGDAITYDNNGRPSLTEKAHKIIKGMIDREELPTDAEAKIIALSEFAPQILEKHYRFDTKTLLDKNYANLYADKIVNTVNSIRGQGNEIEPNLREVIKNLVIMGMENDNNKRKFELLKTIAQMVGLSIFPHLDKLFNEGLYGDETPQPQR